MRYHATQGLSGTALLVVIAIGSGACNLLTGADALELGEQGGGGASQSTSSSTTGTTSQTGTPEVVGAGGSQSGGNGGDGGNGGNGGDGAGSTQGSGGATTTTTTTTPTGPACGDGACAGGETCESCALDCGQCDPCGNGTCDMGETCDTCASDCGACPTCKGAGPATTTLDAEEQAFLVLINEYRAGKSLGALTACTSLNRAAQGHSEDMRDKNYFAHEGLDGSAPWDRSCDACYELGCGPMTAMAENIAAGNATAQATFTQWKNSPGHNANMLGSSFKVIGIGRATGGGQYGVYWTNVFGGDSEGSCN